MDAVWFYPSISRIVPVRLVATQIALRVARIRNVDGVRAPNLAKPVMLVAHSLERAPLSGVTEALLLVRGVRAPPVRSNFLLLPQASHVTRTLIVRVVRQ